MNQHALHKIHTFIMLCAWVCACFFWCVWGGGGGEYIFKLKGKFPQTTMWIGWVESNFTNPTVKLWADLDNPFKRSDYGKLCMSPSLDGTLPEYMISQEDNSPLTLYIEFFKIVNFSWISMVLLIQFIHKCMHIHLSPNIAKYKRRGKIHFHEK